jgi:hypothetical protein
MGASSALMPPLRGSIARVAPAFPGADAPGYIMPPLTGLKTGPRMKRGPWRAAGLIPAAPPRAPTSGRLLYFLPCRIILS